MVYINCENQINCTGYPYRCHDCKHNENLQEDHYEPKVRRWVQPYHAPLTTGTAETKKLTGV